MIAVPLLKGSLTAEDYEDSVADNPLIDKLRSKMQVSEDTRFTSEYLQADKRAIGNSIQVFFNDGTFTDNVIVDYPVGHRRRREEGIPLLKEKFERYLRGRISQKNSDEILSICRDQAIFENTSVNDIMTLLAIQESHQ